MHAVYVDEKEAKRQGIRSGWHVFDKDGKRVEGPFDSEKEAELWIEDNTPKTPPPTPSRRSGGYGR